MAAEKPKAAKAQDSKTARCDAACPNRGNPLAQSCVPDGWGFTYTTPPLTTDTELTGHPIVHLWISTTAPDLNFFAYLEDVAPDGKVSVITDGRLKASMRALATPPYSNFGLPYQRMFEEDRQLLKPGEPVELVFDMLPLSQVFAKGHRLRLTLTNADPREKDRQVIAPAPMVSLLRDRAHASYVTLPVIATRQ